jgi:hypothetical protein
MALALPLVQRKAWAMKVALRVAGAGGIGEADHVAPLVDVHRRVPGLPAQIGISVTVP